jgi:GAF domain-containing protein
MSTDRYVPREDDVDGLSPVLPADLAEPFKLEPVQIDSVAEQRDVESWGAPTPEAFIERTLAWCCDIFRASRARFVRPLESGAWIVYTRQREALTTHEGDAAEIAMAYTVGLARHPLVAMRPRVSRPNGSEVRPIALHAYVGVPVICQDRLVGVIELAGDVQPDVESALTTARPRLDNFGERLLFDPELWHRPPLEADSACVLDGAARCRGAVTLSAEELRLVAAMSGPTTVADAAAAAELDTERAVAIANGLQTRGIIAGYGGPAASVRPPA